MRWTQLATGLMVVLWATACPAETPDFSAQGPQAMSIMQRARLLGGQNWWNRFGEPVNAAALSQAEASPSDNSGYVPPPPVYGPGYIFAPGSCDCPPPCIWQLWAGYYQNPHRCNPGGLLHRHCGACGACGAYAGGGGGPCGCGASCGKGVGCGCTTPVSCTTAASGCGCKPVCGKCRHCHLGWHGFGAHWMKSCNSCSTPVSCGCTTPVMPGFESQKQATDKMPVPLSEDAVLYPLPRLN